MPVSDPYEEIYLVRDSWWGLVREEWLSPSEGKAISWNDFSVNIKIAKAFHAKLAKTYHPNTFVYYGASGDKYASFEGVKWRIRKGLNPETGKPPSEQQATAYSHLAVRENGENKIFVGGETRMETVSAPGAGGVVVTYDTSFWEIKCAMQDGRGDGTVPMSSGRAPRRDGLGHIRQQFSLEGFGHEDSYKNATAQRVTHYAITKIAAMAKL